MDAKSISHPTPPHPPTPLRLLVSLELFICCHAETEGMEKKKGGKKNVGRRRRGGIISFLTMREGRRAGGGLGCHQRVPMHA